MIDRFFFFKHFLLSRQNLGGNCSLGKVENESLDLELRISLCDESLEVHFCLHIGRESRDGTVRSQKSESAKTKSRPLSD